jgi:hypothetical protein
MTNCHLPERPGTRFGKSICIPWLKKDSRYAFVAEEVYHRQLRFCQYA